MRLYADVLHHCCLQDKPSGRRQRRNFEALALALKARLHSAGFVFTPVDLHRKICQLVVDVRSNTENFQRIADRQWQRDHLMQVDARRLLL